MIDRLGMLAMASLLAFGIMLTPAEAASARNALSGTASIRTMTLPRVRPYFPRQRVILEADALAARYRLDAAETLYREALRQNPGDAGALNGLGKIAFYRTASSNPHERGQTAAYQAKAIQYWLSALRYEPGYVDARLNLAHVYMAQGRMGESREEINRAIGLTPHYAPGLAALGAWLVGNKRYNEAIPVLSRAIRLDARNVSAHYHLAVAREGRNEPDRALRNLHAVLWLDPTHAPAHEHMAQIYEAEGNEAAAVEHYLKALSLKPEMSGARLRLAALYERRGDISEALTHLKNALSEGTEASWSLTERTARLSVRNEQPEVAIALYQDWVEKYPDDAARVQPLLSEAKTGLARKKLRDPDLVSQGAAGMHAGHALRPNPDNFDARLIRSRLNREMGQEPGQEGYTELYAAVPVSGIPMSVVSTSAIPAMTFPVSTSPLYDGISGGRSDASPGMNTWSAAPAGSSPNSAAIDTALRQPVYQPGGFYEKGELLLSRYQFEAAIRAFREARRGGEAHYSPVTFGELFLTLGLPDLAEESFKVALEKQPEDLAARLGIARAESARRDSDEWVAEATRDARRTNALGAAVSRLEKAIRANRTNVRAYDLLARLEEKRGDNLKAADYYYARLQLEPDSPGAGAARRGLKRMRMMPGSESNLLQSSSGN